MGRTAVAALASLDGDDFSAKYQRKEFKSCAVCIDLPRHYRGIERICRAAVLLRSIKAWETRFVGLLRFASPLIGSAVLPVGDFQVALTPFMKSVCAHINSIHHIFL
jgi:hypothetical protein